MTRERWTWIGAAVAIVVALLVGIAIGRSTASGPTQEAAATLATTTSTLPRYGDPAARDTYVAAVNGSLPLGSTVTGNEILVAGDDVCASLEGFFNQGRDAHYAIRVLWTQDLRHLDSTEVATYGLILSAAPRYLCPQYKPLGDDIAYWLGI